jgi:U4/U6 small nuclear ribonucleoprotein PRP31
MQKIAPNTAALVGATVCAKLIAAAGGLMELSHTPACNIQVLGSERKVMNGLSTAGHLHKGHIQEVDLVRETP